MDIYIILDNCIMFHGTSLFRILIVNIFSLRNICLQIMFNKAVLDQLKFPYPMFLTTWHMTLATILTQLLSKTTKMLPGVTEVILFFFLMESR